jgi:hypothetical protein
MCQNPLDCVKIVKSRDMTGRSRGGWGEGARGKDDRKPNNLAQLCKMIAGIKRNPIL